MRVLRAVEPADGVVTYAFLLEGGSLEEDWELDVLIPAHYGEEEADRLAGEWLETFAPLDAWAERAVSSGQQTNQLVWTMQPVALG